MNVKKCAVIGCGFVGTTTAFTLMNSGLFSEIVLIDVNREKAVGEAMDMNHCNCFLKPTNIYAGDYSDLSDCLLIIIAAGAAQKPNETRLDLLQRNVDIFREIILNIIRHNTDGILLVVSNPVDILTYVTLKLSGFSRSRVIGSGTVLDTARLKYLLGEHLCIDARNVHAFVIGEHGDSELPVFSSANISGINIGDFCSHCGKCVKMCNMIRLFEDVRDSAYEIVKRKSATYYGISLAVLRIAEAIVRDENSILTVSGIVENNYGLNDLCLSLPCIVGLEGIKKVIDIPLSDTERTNLHNSANVIKNAIESICM